MAEGIRLAKGEEVDEMRAELTKKLCTEDLENEGYLKRKVLDKLPFFSTEVDYKDGNSVFTASSRCSTMVVEDDVVYEKITTSSNAANIYAFAYFDISKYTNGAKRITVEYDTKIGKDRWYISLSDIAKRPGESYRSNYDTTGIVISHGTKDGSNYYINSENTWEKGYFDTWVHSKISIDFEIKTVKYELSNGTEEDNLSGVIPFRDTAVSKVTCIEIFSYLNSVEMGIANIKISGACITGVDDRTIYIIPDGSALVEYMYIDEKPVCIGRSDIIGAVADLISRVEVLEKG